MSGLMFFLAGANFMLFLVASEEDNKNMMMWSAINFVATMAAAAMS